MSNIKRLNDCVRIEVRDSGWLLYATRTGTSSSDHFGDAQQVGIPGDEMQQIIAAYLRENPNTLKSIDDIDVQIE